MKKVISLFFTAMISATVAVPPLSFAGAIEPRSLAGMIADLSPVPLDDTLWVSYATCLTQRAEQQPRVTASTIARYIATFDRPDGSIRGDLAYHINEQVIRPCLVENPLYEGESLENNVKLTYTHKM